MARLYISKCCTSAEIDKAKEELLALDALDPTLDISFGMDKNWSGVQAVLSAIPSHIKTLTIFSSDLACLKGRDETEFPLLKGLPATIERLNFFDESFAMYNHFLIKSLISAVPACVELKVCMYSDFTNVEMAVLEGFEARRPRTATVMRETQGEKAVAAYVAAYTVLDALCMS